MNKKDFYFPIAKQTSTIFTEHSARVKLTHQGPKLWRLDYTGVISAKTFASLRAKSMAVTRGALLLRIHVERALITTPPAPIACAIEYKNNPSPATVRVRPDQYQAWSDLAAAMEGIGVTRLVFLESQVDIERRFVACLLAAHGLKGQPLPA